MRAVNKTAQVPMIGFPLLFSVADPGSGAGGSRLGGGGGSGLKPLSLAICLTSTEFH